MKKKEIEKRMRKMISDSAQGVEIPESLGPEAVAEKLERQKEQNRLNRQEEMRKASEDSEGKEQQSGERRFRKRKIMGNGRIRYLSVLSSAAALLLITVCSFALFRELNGSKTSADSTELAGAVGGAGEQEILAGAAEEGAVRESAGVSGNADGRETAGTMPEAAKSQARQDAGEMYTVAKDYKEIYEKLKEAADRSRCEICYVEGGAVMENSVTADGFDGTANSGRATEPARQEKQSAQTSVGAAEKEYSDTNVMQEGVDESDIIKTDGSFLYVVKNNRIYIIDIQNGQLQEKGQIALPSAEADVREIYLDGNRLLVLAEERTTRLSHETMGSETGDNQTLDNTDESTKTADSQAGNSTDGSTKEAAGQSADSIRKTEADTEQDYYSIVTSQSTGVYTYDITQKYNPTLLGTVSQDGNYYTSRKIGNMVYLFTTYSIYETLYTQPVYRYQSDQEPWNFEKVQEFLPKVNGQELACGNIYLGQEAQSGLLISSIDIRQPDQTVDNILICHEGAEIYVTEESVYLYHTNYFYDTNATQIARFALKDGYLDAAGAASVDGVVRDTFAVNEYGDSFRILTTDVRSGEGSNLYLFDRNLKYQGRLENIAPGELIYAARYFEDMAYFVTYRNMDPLFAVDLSDPENPEILGELKITGYSDYLHIWDAETLFGIGYETDPDSGTQKGIKITLFDISSPADLKVINSSCLKNAFYTPALDQYKTVLVSPAANLIGFTVMEENSDESVYLLYSLQNGAFHNLLTRKLEDEAVNIRGIYAGDFFYIASPDRVISFDRKNDYREIAVLEIGK